MEFDKITGSSVKKIFEALIEAKTLVNIHVAGTRYEQLTVITGFRRKLGRLHFLLGYPDGFEEAATGTNTWSIDYEFTGTDGIPYKFSSSGGEVYRNQLSIPFPQYLNREQRRKYFRLEAPDGTMCEFNFHESECQEMVVDVSVGGALIALVCFDGKNRGDFPYKVGDVIENLELIFPVDSSEEKIWIKKATVVRFDHGRSKARTCCGLEFTEVDQSQERALTDFIYKYQRKYLRKRIRPDIQ
jgi:c-di-GMP-binding flagellar brake protein YcgR